MNKSNALVPKDAVQISRSKNAVVICTLVLLVLMLGLVAFVTLDQYTWMIKNRRAVLASYELSGQLEKPLQLLKDAENAAQSYLLTGDESCLAPLKKAAVELDPTFERLERQFSQDAQTVKQLTTLKDYYDREFRQLNEFLIVRQKMGNQSVTPPVIRAMIGQIEANSHNLPLTTYGDQRQFRIAATKALSRQTDRSTAELLWLVGLALVGVTGTTIYAIFQLRARDQANEMVQQVDRQAKLDEMRIRGQYEVTKVLAEGVSLTDSVEPMLQLLCRYFDWQIGLLWLRDGEILRCQSVVQADGSELSEFEDASRALTLGPGDGLPGRVWSNLRPAWISDLVGESKFPRAEVAGRAKLQGAFALPIMAAHEFVGVLEFYSNEQLQQDDDQVATLQAICSQLGQFVQRLKAYELLAISESRYLLAIDGAMDGIWDWNIQTGTMFLSPRMREMMGFEQGESLSSISEVGKMFHPDDRDMVMQKLEDHAQGRSPSYQAVLRARDKSGNYRWYEGRGMASGRDADGVAVRMAGSVRDITIEREAKEAFRLSEQKFQAIFDSTFEFIGLLSPDGTLLEANRAALSFVKGTTSDFVGKPLWQGPWFEERDHERIRQAIACAASGKFDRFEMQHTSGDNTMTVDFSMTPVFDASGEVVLLIPEGRDITELKVVQANLKESEAMFRQLAENIRDIFWVANPDSSKFFYISPAFEEITGRSREGVYDNPRSFWDSLDHKDRRKAYWDFKGFAQGKGPREAEYRVIRPDGEVRWVFTKVFPIFNDQGEMVRSCGVIRDINDRKEAERRVSEFYSTVSHELRSPLTSIRGALGLIEGGVVGEVSEQVLSFVTIARAESDRLIRLVNNILDLRKIEAGCLELKCHPVSVLELVDSTLDALQGTAAQTHIELVGPERTDFVLSLDNDQIKQVLTNLISNALKFSPEGGKVTVRLHQDGAGFLRFEVADHGPGIAKAQAHRLFGKFQQLDSSDTRAQGGTGLGLAISKAIVEQHGGVIGFDSVEGEGATFWFKLPLPQLKVDAKHKVLIFSSDGILSERLKEIVSLDTVTVTTTDTPDDALRLLKESGIGVLILDTGKSLDAGLKLMTRLPELKRPVPVIVVSGEHVNAEAYGDAFVLDAIVGSLDGPAFSTTIAQSIARCDAKSPQVLIVEDDPATRTIVKEQIGAMGINCIEARDGEAALALVRSHTPDLIVLDLGLPKLDGFELIAAMRKEAKDVPVIIYTARDLTAEDEAALSLGRTRYLTKSQSSVGDLLQAVRELLSGIVAGKR